MVKGYAQWLGVFERGLLGYGSAEGSHCWCFIYLGTIVGPIQPPAWLHLHWLAITKSSRTIILAIFYSNQYS